MECSCQFFGLPPPERGGKRTCVRTNSVSGQPPPPPSPFWSKIWREREKWKERQYPGDGGDTLINRRLKPSLYEGKLSSRKVKKKRIYIVSPCHCSIMDHHSKASLLSDTIIMSIDVTKLYIAFFRSDK